MKTEGSLRVRVFVALCLTLLIAGCGKREPSAGDAGAAAPPVKLRVQLNWVPEPEFGGLYAAREQGLYREAGLDVEIIKGSAGVPAAQLAASGQVEFGVTTAPEIVQLRARGAPIVAVYAQFRRSPRAVIVHATSPHQTLESLWKSDGRVMFEPGQTFAKWLDRRFGGERLQRLPSTGNLAGFIADPTLAQAVYVFAEPVELDRRGVPVAVLDVASTGFDPYEAVIATREAWLEANPDVARRFVDATRKGWDAYLAGPGPINVVMARENPAMSKDAMDTSARLAEPYVRGEGGALGAMTVERWQTLIEQLVELGEVEAAKAPPAVQCFVRL